MQSILEIITDAWGWAGLVPEEIVGENEFGNLIVRDVNGVYWRICPEDVYCEIIAKSREELDSLSTDPEFLKDWYMRSLVEIARSKLGDLKDGYKYCLAIPGVLGGSYDGDNINTVPLDELIALSGDIGQQLKDLPDGSQVKLKVVD